MSTPEPWAATEENARPIVASATSNRSLWVFGAALVIGGVLLFRGLESRRAALTAPAITVPADSAVGLIAAPPDLAVSPLYDPGYAIAATAYPPLPARRPAVPVSGQDSAAWTGRPRSSQSLPHYSSVPERPTMQQIAASQRRYQPPAMLPGVPEPPTLDGSTSLTGGKERVEAARFANPATTVSKGTVIQGVLETALDSNRPGFARAIVSRDVMGFDGSRVLIPRGSRIFGEYKSDVTLGQNRVLIQWQRLMRPDGIFINLDSPSADPLGRAGVKGKVNSHFFQRFAGSILQSTLDIGTQLATREVSDDAVYIGLPGLTQGVVATPEKIPPTVKVRQGRSVSVFVARDLDFTRVSE